MVALAGCWTDRIGCSGCTGRMVFCGWSAGSVGQREGCWSHVFSGDI